MGAIANIVINDGQAAPVAHTFAPLSIVGNLATYEDRSGGISVGYPRILIWVNPPSKTSRLQKVRIKIMRPSLESVTNSTYSGITPAPTKAYDTSFDCTFFLPERGTLADRKDILAYAKNLLGHAVGTAIVETQEAIY